MVFGKEQQIDLETGEIGLHATPAVTRDGVVMIGVVDARRRHAEDAQQHQGAGARLRRAHRQAAVDVQHDSASGRVRQRHVGERIVGGQRQRRRLEPDRRRRGARPRLSAGRDAELRLLRRPPARATTCSPRASSRSTTRPASASGTSSSCTIRSGTWTSRRRRCSSTSPSNGRPVKAVAVMGKQALLYRLRPRHRRADLSDRRAAGAAVRRAGREDVADAAVSDQAAGLRLPGRRRSRT